ncbi:MAG: MBL fold metallo-hydrolase, partial [Bacillota bacterium]
MEIIFTGTGSGRTSLKRHHNSIILSSSGTNLLIDAGDGISRALLNSTVDYNSINAILFTHFHPDHLNGISSLLIQMKMNSRSSELRLLVHQNLYRSFLRFLETGYIF